MRVAATDSDTIAAIATPLGEGGLAVLRISGPRSVLIADQVFRPAGRSALAPSAAPSHTLHYGHIERDGRTLDEVLLTVLRAPRTFTREDTVEVSCHGGVFVARQVLDALLSAGARLAEPGEFTRRAFLNGRLDLAQAEAVADVIHSRTERALAAAQEQLGGSLSRRIHRLRDEWMIALAHLEAHIDFPDEDLAPDTHQQLLGRLNRGLEQLDALLATAREGQVLRRGVRAAIIGRPNAGKSSLLNSLLGHDRAIVSPIAGTTRDTIEETASIQGLPVVFVDTAGLRAATDPIEEEGIRRTRAAASRAEILLHLLDGSEPLSAIDRLYLAEFAAAKRLLVVNKSDLDTHPEVASEPCFRAPDVLRVSCVTGEGLEALKWAIAARIGSGRFGAGMQEATINARHEDALRRARRAGAQAAESLIADQPPEIVALDLRIALSAVGEIVGKTTTEDLLDAIFSQFCIGK